MKISYLLIPSMLLLSNIAQAKTLSEALLECARVGNSLQRLVCYDNLSRDIQLFEDVPVPADLGNIGQSYSRPSSTPSIPSAAPKAKKNKVDDFGLTVRQQEHSKEDFGLNPVEQDTDDKIYLTVSEVKEAPRKELIITATNGQVWKQIDTERFRIKEGEVIYIERGAIGSFWLSKDDVRKRIRVKRQK